MTNRQRKFRMEKLEARELMAGDVAASVNASGDLILNEAVGQAGLDNAVWVSRLADGRIRVDGNFAPDGTRSLVNGQNFQEFAVTGKLIVTFGGGNDLVVLDGINKPAFQEVHIDVGSATSAADEDDVMIWGAVSRGNTTINTGAGNDWVYVTGAAIGTATNAGNLTINTGAGADGVDVESLGTFLRGSIDIQTYASLNETDADRVNVEDVSLADDLRIRLGGGDDDLRLNIVAAFDDIDIDAGAGNDKAKLEHVTAIDDLMARMGDGTDRFEIYYSTAADLVASGGGGMGDMIFTRDLFGSMWRQTNSFGTKSLSDWEWIDGIRPWMFEDFTPAKTVRTPLIRF
jgi:hypothetical protein